MADTAASKIEYSVISSLAALRSSAEILRDCPELDGKARDRFLQIILSEETRLESSLRSLLDRSGTSPSSIPDLAP
ncbi:MAG: hypothetical protein AAF317_05675 [Pseudomonadota bacterium]